MRRHRRQLSATVRHCDAVGALAPCVDVKVRGRLYDRLPADVQDYDPDNEVWNLVVAQWWELVPQELADTYLRSVHPGSQPKVWADGRSGGWCCVAGIGVPEDWSERQFVAWRKFEDAVHQSMTEYEAVYADTVRANKSPAEIVTAPHGRCHEAARCVEPVPRGERCR